VFSKATVFSYHFSGIAFPPNENHRIKEREKERKAMVLMWRPKSSKYICFT